jgi:hypothetical protein
MSSRKLPQFFSNVDILVLLMGGIVASTGTNLEESLCVVKAMEAAVVESCREKHYHLVA